MGNKAHMDQGRDAAWPTLAMAMVATVAMAWLAILAVAMVAAALASDHELCKWVIQEMMTVMSSSGRSVWM